MNYYVVCEQDGWQSKSYKRKSSADRIAKAYNAENKDSGFVWKTVREDELKKETIKTPGWSDDNDDQIHSRRRSQTVRCS